MFVLIPPAMALAPAPFPRRVQFATLVLGLPAVASVAVNGFVQLMLGMLDAPLASIIIIVGMHARHRRE
jgi:hypothetical protein